MLEILIYPMSFIVALALLIAVHEFGHFWVARKLGVKVLRFSIGFGKPIWKRKSRVDDTEYVLAAVPLGGYVKMLDEREGEVDEQDKPVAFNNKSVWVRFAIVAAGPIFNFLFAILILWIMYMTGIHGLKAVVGDIVKDSYAEQGGFQYGDQILRIDDVETPTWNMVRMNLLDAALDNKTVRIDVRDSNGEIKLRNLKMDAFADPVESKDLLGDLGLQLWSPPAELGELVEGGASERAGLKEGDIIISVDNRAIKYWIDWVKEVRNNPGKEVEVLVDRDGSQHAITLHIEEVKSKGKLIGKAQVALPTKYWDMLDVRIDYTVFEAFEAGVVRTWDMSVLMLRVLGRIVMGDSSLKNISGPLTIAQYAGSTANLGIIPFLSFLSIVSISLGVLNLLPIPVLDGGHLFYYLIEMITGKPVSEQFQATAQQFGIFLLVALMALAFYNDILRLFG
jgi:regulator of sigma E protease